MNLILKQNKQKKNTDENNHMNSSKRNIGPIALNLDGILDNLKPKKNHNISSESSKEIDFEQNKNIVINPYCFNIPKETKQNNKNISIINNNDIINGKSENKKESKLHDIDDKHKKIIFSKL